MANKKIPHGKETAHLFIYFKNPINYAVVGNKMNRCL